MPLAGAGDDARARDDAGARNGACACDGACARGPLRRMARPMTPASRDPTLWFAMSETIATNPSRTSLVPMSIDVPGRVLSVNLARVRPNPYQRGEATTGIDKAPTPEPVLVRAPGTMRDGLGSGLVGDMVGDRLNHGGDAQAVYAYAREDLDQWESVLGRTLACGVFGENLTTTGVDVNGAVIGERWRIGDELELAVTVPRIPCGTFLSLIHI